MHSRGLHRKLHLKARCACGSTHFEMERVGGIEPLVSSLEGYGSAIELHPQWPRPKARHKQKRHKARPSFAGFSEHRIRPFRPYSPWVSPAPAQAAPLLKLVRQPLRAATLFVWCPRRDSNPHVFRQRILSPPRLPVPPPGQVASYSPSGALAGLNTPSSLNSLRQLGAYCGKPPNGQVAFSSRCAPA